MSVAISVGISKDALKLAGEPPPEVVYADDGVYAGLAYPGGRWECGSCVTDGIGGREALLVHDASHEGSPA